jgi:hypothetical protein
MICIAVPVICTGTAGSATGTTTVSVQPHSGVLYAVYMDHHTSQATTDTTVQVDGLTVLVKADSKDDAWYYPRLAVCDADGTGLVYTADDKPICEPAPVTATITVSVAQGAAVTGGPSVTAYCYIQEDAKR